MPSYIVDRYAGILTKEDIEHLFGELVKRLRGNRSEAVRQCGLTGKATYDWERAGYVKLGTKRKVLEACLGADFLNTLEYLLSRSSERTVDILRTFLSTIYAEAVETDSKDQFCILHNRFDNLRMKYRGLIRDRIEDEIADMLWLLGEKASELGAPSPPKLIEDVSAKELLDAIPLIGDAYIYDPREARSIAETLNLPVESVETLCSTFEKFRSAREIVISGIYTTAAKQWSEAMTTLTPSKWDVTSGETFTCLVPGRPSPEVAPTEPRRPTIAEPIISR